MVACGAVSLDETDVFWGDACKHSTGSSLVLDSGGHDTLVNLTVPLMTSSSGMMVTMAKRAMKEV